MRGHIRPRGKSLEVRVFAGQVDGRKRYITRTIRWQGSKRATNKLAEEELTKILGELDDGAHTGPDASMNTLFDRWWQLHAPRWSPSTAARNESALNAHLRPWFGPTIVRKVRTEDVDAFLSTARASMAPSSLAKLRTLLGSALGQAVRWGWIARNPVDNAAKVSVRRADIKPPAPADIRKLLELARKRDPDWATFIHLDAVTGARRGELCGLRWEDIEADDTLTIRRGIVRSTGNKYVVRPTTKSHRERTVPLDAGTVALLKTHRRRCAARALACGVSLGGYIFSYEPDGSRPWHPNSVTQRWRRLRAKAKLPTVRLHDVRHYVATRLLDAGIPAATVAERLGHAHEQVTRTIYSHPVSERAGVAAEVAATVLRDG